MRLSAHHALDYPQQDLHLTNTLDVKSPSFVFSRKQAHLESLSATTITQSNIRAAKRMLFCHGNPSLEHEA